MPQFVLVEVDVHFTTLRSIMLTTVFHNTFALVHKHVISHLARLAGALCTHICHVRHDTGVNKSCCMNLRTHIRHFEAYKCYHI